MVRMWMELMGLVILKKLVSAKTALTNFLFFGNTLALFGNTFVTHIDDFAIRQIHNLLTNSYLQKEYIKEEQMIKYI